MATAGRLGMLIIRVWREDTGDPDALRARLTESVDIDSDERTIATAATVEGICGEVREWLDRFLRVR
jgi:hypothetical protein